MLLVVIVLLALAGSVLYQHTPETSKVTSPAVSPTPQPIISQSDPKTFDPQYFYDKIATGMDFATLNQLAGKMGDCASTGVYPTNDSYPCYWSNSEYRVSVTLNGKGVSSKSITRR